MSFEGTGNNKIRSPRGRLLNATTLKYLRTGATVGSALLDTYEIIQAYRADIQVSHSNADQIIEELKDEIEELREKLRKRKSEHERQNIRQRIQVAKGLIRDAMRVKKGVPSKYIKTCSAVAGKWVVGTTAGAAGASAGAAIGAMYGSLLGPAGAATGATIGGVIGGFGLGMVGGEAGRWVGEITSNHIMNICVDSDSGDSD